MKMTARVGYAIAASVLVLLIALQFYHAGMAVLVHPGDWRSHTGNGHMLSLPILLMALFSLAGWMPFRFFLTSLALYLLYLMQYLLLYLPGRIGLPALAALHPVNGLLLLWFAQHTARSAWRRMREDWQQVSRTARRAVWILLATVAGAAVLAWGPGSGGRAEDRSQGPQARSLAGATEASLPERYRAMQNPLPPGDEGAVASGRRLAEQKCISCHAADLRGRQLGGVRSADLTQSAASRSEQFLMWAISEGSQTGMPAWGAGLSEEERWHLVAFMKSLHQ